MYKVQSSAAHLKPFWDLCETVLYSTTALYVWYTNLCETSFKSNVQLQLQQKLMSSKWKCQIPQWPLQHQQKRNQHKAKRRCAWFLCQDVANSPRISFFVDNIFFVGRIKKKTLYGLTYRIKLYLYCTIHIYVPLVHNLLSHHISLHLVGLGIRLHLNCVCVCVNCTFLEIIPSKIDSIYTCSCSLYQNPHL